MSIVKKNGEIIYPAVRRGKNMKEETEELIRETEEMVHSIPEEEKRTPEFYAERLHNNLEKLDDNIHRQDLFDDMTDRWGTPVMCALENEIEAAGGAEECYICLLQEWIKLAEGAGNKMAAEVIGGYLEKRGEGA